MAAVVSPMLTHIYAAPAMLVCRFRSRAELELEIVALRHHLSVLQRQRPGRPRLCVIDRLLWVWLYRGRQEEGEGIEKITFLTDLLEIISDGNKTSHSSGVVPKLPRMV